MQTTSAKNPILLITVVILIVLVLVGGIIAGLYYFRQTSPQNSSTQPAVTIGGPAAGTAGIAVTFTATSSSGVAPFTFQWTATGGSTTSGSGNSFTTTYTTPGSYTISVTATDANAKKASANHSITIQSPPGSTMAMTVSGPTTETVGSPVTFMASATGGTLPYSFAWTSTGGSPPSATNAGFSTTQNPDGSATRWAGFTTTYNTAGHYSVSVTATDANTNSASKSASVSISLAHKTAIFTVYDSPPYMPYTVLIPQGWTGYSGQTFKAFQVPGIGFAAWNSGHNEAIFFAQPDYPGFIDPSSTDYLGNVGSQYPTGTFYSGTNLLVYPTPTASQYVQQILTKPCQYAVSVLCSLLETSHDPSFSLTASNVVDRPDLVNKSHNWFELTCGGSQTAATSAADGNLTYTATIGQMQVGVIVEICQASILNLHYWYASVSGYAAPTSQTSDAVATYKTVMPTTAMNYAWIQSVISNAAAQGQIISGYIKAWTQANLESIQITLGSPNAATGWIDALDGVNTGTAGGYDYKIPYGYNAWVSNPGSISADVCLASDTVVPSDCPSGAVAVTFPTAAYPKVLADNEASNALTISKLFETLRLLVLIPAITSAGVEFVIIFHRKSLKQDSRNLPGSGIMSKPRILASSIPSEHLAGEESNLRQQIG